MSKSNRKEKFPNNEYGKLPPQNVQFEESILGGIISYSDRPEYLEATFKFLRPKVFYKTSHSIIYKTILDLYNSDRPHDILSVISELERNGELDTVGGKYYITYLTTIFCSYTTIEFHSAFVFECFIRRELIQLLSEKINELYDYKMDIVDIYDSLHERLESVFDFLDSELVHSIDSIVDRTLNELKNVSEGKINNVIKFNDVLFDKVYVMPYDIISIAAARGAGKTRYLIKLMKGLFESNKDVCALWYSMEDSDTKIMRLWASMDTGIPDNRMQGKGDKLTKEEYERISKSMVKFKSYDCEIINDQESISVINRRFNKFMKKKGREDKFVFLIIDNIMLVEDIYNATNGNAIQIEDMVAGSIRKIINKGKRANIKVVIIFLHHMTKEMESRANSEEAYRPKLSHVKGSTRFVDICSIAALINNPGMHKDLIKKHSVLPDIKCLDSEGNTKFYKRESILSNLIIVEIAKNRDGDVDENKMICRYLVDMGKMKFSELKALGL